MFNLLFGLSMLAAVPSEPSYDDEGYEAAVKLCSSFSWESDRTECLSKIRGKTFDERAVKICTTFSWDSNKTDCLQKISNKYYRSETELKLCADITWESDRLNCLGEADSIQHPVGGPIDPIYARSEIRRALKELRNQEYDRVDYRLERLLKDL